MLKSRGTVQIFWATDSFFIGCHGEGKEEQMKLYRRSDKTALLITGLIFLLKGATSPLAESPPVLEVGRFSTEKAGDALPIGWEPFTFKKIERCTEYRLVEMDGHVVVQAEAEASASALMRKISIDPRKYPILQWCWKVANILKKGNLYRKEGDDYPARIYIIFEYDSERVGFSEKLKYEAAKLLYGAYPPLATLNYVWSSNAPVGTVVPNPYTDRAMMVVVQSGEKNLNTWLSEERNIYADYRKAFKDEPPMISGVAIMTDADDTREKATAYYGDILFSKEGR